MSHLPDKDILQLIRDGQNRNHGFNLLIKKYQQRVYMLIRRLVYQHSDADDLTQDTFVKVYEKIDQFREDSGLFTWLYRIATNEALSFLKKKKRMTLSLSDNSRNLTYTLSEDPLFDGDSIQQKLFEAIDMLPDKQKLVFNMKYFEEMKYEEISKVLGTSVGALKTSYHLAVKKIGKYVQLD